MQNERAREFDQPLPYRERMKKPKKTDQEEPPTQKEPTMERITEWP